MELLNSITPEFKVLSSQLSALIRVQGSGFRVEGSGFRV
jgi:hypothetical protein